MGIYVDADACPVKKEIVAVAQKLNIEVVMLMDTSHMYDDGYSKVFIVDQGKDSVDYVLVNMVSKDDVVVTQDYGVASMVLSKGAYAINQNGLIYSEGNIERLLFERHLSQELRRSGKKSSRHKKRSKDADLNFQKIFEKLCNQVYNKVR